jgi:DNA-binding response OmpR family regulator
MPGMDGIEATHQITSRQPKARILMLTGFAADNKVLPASKAGAAGYLLKDSSPDELVRAIRQVHRGEPSLHPTIARKRLRAFFVRPIHQTSYINVSRVTQQVALLLPKNLAFALTTGLPLSAMLKTRRISLPNRRWWRHCADTERETNGGSPACLVQAI